MGRFSVSPPGSCLVSPEPWQDDGSSTSSEIDQSIDSQTSGEDDYPHPLGFPSLGKTRFFLDPPRESVQQLKRRLGFLQERDDLLDGNGFWEDVGQEFPPLSSFIDAKTAPTEALLAYSDFEEERPEQDDSVDNVMQLLRAASLVESPTALKLMSESQQAGQRLWALCKTSERERQSIRHRMDLERQRLEKEHAEAAEGLRLLLKRDQQAAEKILKQQQEVRRAVEEAEQLQRDEEKKDEEERQRVAVERERKQQEKEERVSQEEKKRKEAIRKQKKEAAEEEAKKSEYVVKAKKLVAKLVDLRASVAPFETSKNVSRRRLNMKKTVKGKVNTLSLDAHKIQSVANEVANAVQQAREEDEQLKQQFQAGDSQITSEMMKGKRYLVDLLASDTMVRAQAEGFNGPRGDGFPLACMLAMVSTQAKDLVPILAAHVYTVCPIGIPTLPKLSKNASEDELMESLGMSKGKDGQYETFERFLTRTEGIVSLVAEIMSSTPADHILLGGHKGAIEWLERFLLLLPPSPETLPLVTAPVLDAFLTGAGHMLANKYPGEFKKHLNAIIRDTVTRLDEGSIGAPSALRLKKVVENGFDFFKTTLPSKAIPSLYNASSGESGAMTPVTFGASTAVATSSLTRTSESSPFGGGQRDTSTTTFGSTESGSGMAPNPFSARSSSGIGVSSAFGGSSGSATNTSPFGASANQSTSFTLAPQSAFGGGTFGSSSGNAMNASPFGQVSGSTMNASPFGAPATQSSAFAQAPQSSFGGDTLSGSGGNAMNASPFGQASGSSMNASPFGAPPMQSSSSSQATHAAFGGGTFGSSGGNAMNASPFGPASGSAMNASPFGASASQTSSFAQAPQSAFGGGTFGSSGGNAMNASSFGQASGSAMYASPFGAPGAQSSPYAQAPQSAFGGGTFGSSSGNAMNASPFGQASGSAMNASPFGAPAAQSSSFAPAPQLAFGGGTFGSSGKTTNASPFGQTGSQSSSSAFGSVSNPFGPPVSQINTAFGSSTVTRNPFGSSSTTFGGSIEQQQAIGGYGNQQGGNQSSAKAPCKFFAQGKCTFGDNCRFSHETLGQSVGLSGGFDSNTSNFGFGGGGSNAQQQSGGVFSNQGGGNRNSGKPPCKFFEQGTCRNGDNCRFSHEIPRKSGGGGFGGLTNNVGFGGGGNAGNNPFGGGSAANNPFGGPRR